MEPASSQESCSWEGTACFQMDRGNPGLSFGPLVARRWSRPSTPGSPDTCVRRQALLLSHRVSRHVRILEAPQVGPPLHSRSVSGSAGWWSSSHWPSVGVGAAACQAQGSGLRIRDLNENRTKHMGRVCVCVCVRARAGCVCVVGGHCQKSEANLPSTAWGERWGRGESSLTKVPRCLESVQSRTP